MGGWAVPFERADTAERVAAAAMPQVDDRVLLEKYVDHVRQCGGIDFISCINVLPEFYSDVVFTDAEVARMKSLERE